MLQGERVLLRAIRPSDIERLNAFSNDVTVELAGGGDPPLPQALERLRSEIHGQFNSGGRDGTSFVVEADGICIGHCALFRLNQVARTYEMGITIGDQAYWGKGYGREVIRLLLDYGFRYHNLHKVYLNVHARNERAIRCYCACGFVEEGRLRSHVWSDGAYDDLVYMGILRNEWQEKMMG